MSGQRSGDKVRITEHRAENIETVSSPHTYAYTSGNGPATTKADHPAISNVTITSAVSGLPPSYFTGGGSGASPSTASSPTPAVASYRKLMGALSGGGGAQLAENGFPRTTRRVETLSFDVDNISPPIANMLRRVITTEVPTMAIDRILIEENDSVVLDELLSHRLGLCPVAGPVAKMEYITDSHQAGFSNLDPRRVLVFELEAEGAKDAAITPVYSRELRWVPLPGQECFLPPGPSAAAAAAAAVAAANENEEAPSAGGCGDEDRIFIVHPDILLTKLGPGQKLKLRAIAVKGIGAVHTKWSPVASCFYEMRTSISFKEPVKGEAAKKLVKACPMGVFEIENGVARVADVSQCTLCRECIRKDAYPEFAEDIVIEKDKTRIRFHVESVGNMHAAQVFRIALTLFAARVRQLSQTIQSTEVRVVEPTMKQF